MNRKYSKEFKQEAIDIALHSDKPAYKIAQDLVKDNYLRGSISLLL